MKTRAQQIEQAATDLMTMLEGDARRVRVMKPVEFAGGVNQLRAALALPPDPEPYTVQPGRLTDEEITRLLSGDELPERERVMKLERPLHGSPTRIVESAFSILLADMVPTISNHLAFSTGGTWTDLRAKFEAGLELLNEIQGCPELPEPTESKEKGSGLTIKWVEVRPGVVKFGVYRGTHMVALYSSQAEAQRELTNS